MIDTRKAVKELKAVGFSEDQADLVASLFSSTIPWEELVTKEHLSKELDLVGHRLDNKLEVMRGEMNESLASLRAEMNELQASLRGEMSELQTNLHSEMALLEQSLDNKLEVIRGDIARQSTSQIKWIVSMQALILGIALAVSKLL